jgi:CheY-like chemotaxis protein
MESISHRFRIAIVEDESIIAMELKKVLIDLGYDISFIVDTGERAIEMIKASQSDAVLMDIELKGFMDGIETASHIINRFNVPIVFLTAYEDDIIVKRAMKLKNFGFITKPYENTELRTAIENATGQQRIEAH